MLGGASAAQLLDCDLPMRSLSDEARRFLDRYPVYLVIVRNDWFKNAELLRAACSSLKRIEHIFEPVVNIVNEGGRGREVERDVNFQLVGCAVVNAACSAS